MYLSSKLSIVMLYLCDGGDGGGGGGGCLCASAPSSLISKYRCAGSEILSYY